jgi:hypothetical protein
VSDFFPLKHHEKLAGKGYTGTLFECKEIEIEPEPDSRGQSRFLSVPPEIVSAYWLWQTLAFCMGLITESLEPWVDEALGVTRTRERNKSQSKRVQELEQGVREAFAC